MLAEAPIPHPHAGRDRAREAAFGITHPVGGRSQQRHSERTMAGPGGLDDIGRDTRLEPGMPSVLGDRLSASPRLHNRGTCRKLSRQDDATTRFRLKPASSASLPLGKGGQVHCEYWQWQFM